MNNNKNALIGIFVLAAIGVITYMLLFIHPKVGDEGQTLRVRFTDIDKISIGTRVLFAGYPVGEVTNIQEIENARMKEDLHKGQVYIYELTLQIDSGVVVYTTDLILPMTSGLLGEKQVLISPRPAKPGEKLVRITDQIVFSEPQASIEDTVKIIGEVAEKISRGLQTLEKDKFWENLGETGENIADITASINPDEVEKFVSGLNKGTVGKLVGTDDLYLRLTSVLSKGETVMDDINHFGLLFNTNKTWQRLRARRANIMATLCSPQEFSNFFNDEINQISTSLGRVNMVLQDGDCGNYWRSLCSKEFEVVFADLMRRIEGLEENIKLVNQQVVDSRDCGCE